MKNVLKFFKLRIILIFLGLIIVNSLIFAISGYLMIYVFAPLLTLSWKEFMALDGISGVYNYLSSCAIYDTDSISFKLWMLCVAIGATSPIWIPLLQWCHRFDQRRKVKKIIKSGSNEW